MSKIKLPKYRFMAMSKLIGLICFLCLFVIIIYSMYEMHRTGDLSNLSQLIISAFAFASIYAGFYLNMAKVEHLEAEKSACKKELELMRKSGKCSEEDIEQHRQEIQSIMDQLNNIMSQDIHTLS